MKLLSLLATAVISTTAPLFALTDADIAPAALVGKTLVFEIVNGGAPYATTGSWSGSFAASGNGFTVTKVTGDTVPISTTYTATSSGGFTNCALPKFIEGQSTATLTLYIQDGIGKYEVFTDGLFGVSLNGTFTIGVPPVETAEIDVKLGKKTELVDGKSKVDFSTVLITGRGKSRTKAITITNSGTKPLKNLGFSVDGKNRKEFTVSSPKIAVIVPGGSVTIRVTFTPRVIGKRKAALHIHSNDKDENPFDIRLTGNGGGIK